MESNGNVKASQLVNYSRIDVLIDIHRDTVYNLCYQLTTNTHDAEDLFQEVWVRVVRNFNSYDSSRPFEAWLYVIIVNLYKDKYRKRKRWLNRIMEFFTNEKKDNVLSKIESSDFYPEEHILEKEIIEKLEGFLSGLDDVFRIPIVLYYYKEMTYEEISQVLNIPIGTVKSRLSKGKKKLKQRMEGDGYGV